MLQKSIIRTFPTLYKLDSKGKVREWTIRAFPQNPPYYEQVHGVKGGKLQTTSTWVKEGKNVGKANETTPWEQCQAEAESLWTKKRDRNGYSEVVPTNKKDKALRPMLAKTYEKGKITFPAFAQPKLDGIRCLATIDQFGITLQSRQGKKFTVLKHIELALKPLQTGLVKLEEITLDGELYNHKYKDDFQGIVSAIKRDNPSEDTHLIQYHIYDWVASVDYAVRLKKLQALPSLIKSDNIQWVETLTVNSHNEVLQVHGKFTKAGYEGAIIRLPNGKYEIDKRSSNLLKFKEFIDMEFPIVGAYQNKGKQEDQCTLVCMTDQGAEFGVKPKGTEAEREQYWQDWQAGKLKGKMLTVRFFSWTTSDPPVPRFPIGISLRNYE